MRNRVLLVAHSFPFQKDRASDHLAGMGFEIDFRYPCNGDQLGDLTDDIAGTIVYGGKYSVSEIPDHPFLQDEIRWLRQCIDAGLPTLGLCQGGQMIAHILGASVGPHPDGVYEFGYYPLFPVSGSASFLPETIHVPQSHFHAFDIPQGAELLASSDTYPHQAFRWRDHVYGFQFHPEATPEFIEENWLSRPWAISNSAKPNAQTPAKIRELGRLHERKLDTWFRGFLTDLFGDKGAQK